jgi:predicted DCC family thiol-disulfide oxidoreductase YuxK
MVFKSPLRVVAPVSAAQFAMFRIAFGAYLTVHFAYLVPYASELFSRQGVLPRASLNAVHGVLPNLLTHWDTPIFTVVFLVVLTVLALLFLVGFWRRAVAVALWYGWACLFNRNNLIANPSLPYVGLLLLACAIIPSGEPWALDEEKRDETWELPGLLFGTAWVLLAIGYTASGLIKLQSPSWVDGTALWHVVENPLARPGLIRTAFLALPLGLIKWMTWGALALETLFMPLAVFRRTRGWAWGLMIAMHLGILLVVNFADLTVGMLMIHFFTFDPRWFPARARISGEYLILFDGTCGLCDRVVQFLLAEDREHLFRFSPLQGESATTLRRRHERAIGESESIVLVTNFQSASETVRIRSDAFLAACDALGGLWRVLSWARVVPRPIRDWFYDVIAKNRYALFGRYAQCRVPSGETQRRFIP